VLTPYRGRNRPASQRDANRAHAQLREPAKCPAKSLAYPVQTPPLPLACRATGQAIHVLQTREIGE